MIIPKKEKLSAEELKQVEKIAEDSECSILEIQGRNRCVYAILGDESKEVMFKRIAGLPFIRKVDRIESPYKLMDRRSALADHRVKVGATEVGKNAPFVIGGPCTIDPANPNLFIETAHALKEVGVNAPWGEGGNPAQILFFSGDNHSLDIILQAKEETGLPIDIEVMDSAQLKLAIEAKVDVLQVGTRNALELFFT